MKIRVKLDTRVNGRYEKAGVIVETDEASASRLIMLGWCEAVIEEAKPKRTRKTAKKEK